MAQFKDLLVTGPVRILGDVNFRYGKLSDGYLILQPQVGEGGQILLQAAANDATNNGIMLDTANGDFRIFGMPSEDGVTKTGVGSLLTINPYDSSIDASDYSLKLNALSTNATTYDIIIQNSDKTLCHTPQNKFIQDLGLSQVYNYKGTVTWADLKAITSARVGDVYFISGTDVSGQEGQSWACKQKVDAATGNNYATYWQSLGGTVDLSGYVTKDTEQTIIATKYFSHLRPRSNNTYNLGTSSYKWANVYATTFHGALTGTASRANQLALYNTSAPNGEELASMDSAWGGAVSGMSRIVWRQAWKCPKISDGVGIGDDTGDLVLGLRPGQYSSGGTELCMMIDGDYYAMGNKVLHAGGGTVNGVLTCNGGINWAQSTNITCTPTDNGQEWSFDLNDATYTGLKWHVWSQKHSTILACNTDDASVSMPHGLLKLGTANFKYNTADKCIDVLF